MGLELATGWARTVWLGRDWHGVPVLHGAVCVELPEGAGEQAKVLRRVCAGKGAAVQCNLGDASVIVQEASFPRMGMEDLRSAALIEAAQLIPDVDNMVVDVQALGVSRNGKEETRVMIVAAPKEAVVKRSRALLGAGLEVTAVVPDGIALANAVLALCPPEDEVVVVIQVGEEVTHLVGVPPAGDLLAPLVRRIPGGVDLLGGADEAAGIQNDRSRSAQLERWLGEVERSLDFATQKLGRSAGRTLVTGSAAALKKALELLGVHLTSPISAWNPLALLRRGKGSPEESFVAECGALTAVAVGVALTEGS